MSTEIPIIDVSKNETVRPPRERFLAGPEEKQLHEDEKLLASLETSRTSSRKSIDFARSEEMEKRLCEVIKGEVRFDRGSRAIYATDASNFRQVPIGVVIPQTKEDIINTVKIAREFSAPLVSRGGGTGLAGQTTNAAIVMDMSKYYNKILDINVDKKTARVQPGLVLDQLQKAIKPKGLIFGPDPATHSRCTIGGMMGNNSCGMHAQMAGRMEHNVESLEILTYDGSVFEVDATSDSEWEHIIRTGGAKGDIYRGLRDIRDRYAGEIRQKYPEIPRKVSGYNLDELLPEFGGNIARALVGSESTCVVILEATLQLMPNPEERVLVILGYPDVFHAADHVEDILKFNPIAMEGIDDVFMENLFRKEEDVEFANEMPEGKGWLMIEFGANSKVEVLAQARLLVAAIETLPGLMGIKIISDPVLQKQFWAIRDKGLGVTASVPGDHDTWEGWEDSAVPPKAMGAYLRDIKKLYDKYGFRGSLYGHFGQGCLHTRINYDLKTAPGVEKMRQFLHEAARLITKYGGSLSGEHGDGQSRGELLPIMFGPELIKAFRDFKFLWDPQGKMNPGKVVDPYRVDQNMRLGPQYDPPNWATKFSFIEDKGSFARASLRCVGVGACRTHEGGVMCPSYMATHEEKHSTRGRARMLFEMLEGDPLQKSWKEEKVKDALDLCLSCKGCKKDCPVSVDMATYKAEFLSHYYSMRLRPRTAYAMGLIHWWAKLAMIAPRLANWISHSRFTAPAFKWSGGLAQEREVPSFATETARTWFMKRAKPAAAAKDRPFDPYVSEAISQTLSRARGGESVLPGSRGPVILWIDTFNNAFHPQIAQAAVTVLEAGGYEVRVPNKQLCCGRPLYDYGMLDLAKKLLRETLETLKEEITAGIPVVGLEPSCMAVFRDELCNMFPHDLTAQRLKKQTYLIGEFVEQNAANFKFEDLHRKALVHTHCHQHSIFGVKPDLAALKRAGVETQVLDSGCCGMAGSFGFEKDHYEISQKIGERVLLPAVRANAQAHPHDHLIITNGFSCHEQIEQGTGVQSRHIVEILAESVTLAKKYDHSNV